jgi:hypothetical protein
MSKGEHTGVVYGIDVLVVKVVFFDIGGVIFESPFPAIFAFEKRNNLPPVPQFNCLSYFVGISNKGNQ